MRKACVLSLVLVGMLLAGCAMSPGKSPAQVRAAYSSAGYVDRSFNDMHPDLP